MPHQSVESFGSQTNVEKCLLGQLHVSRKHLILDMVAFPMLNYICQLGRGWESQTAEDVRQQLLRQFGEHFDDTQIIVRSAVW